MFKSLDIQKDMEVVGLRTDATLSPPHHIEQDDPKAARSIHLDH